MWQLDIKCDQIHIMKNIFFLLITCGGTLCNAQIYLTLRPDPVAGKDVIVWSNTPDTSLNTTELKASAWTWGGDAGYQRFLIEFNLLNIPPNAEICYAYLSLYASYYDLTQTNSTADGTNISYLYRVVDPWVETEVDWNTQPGYSTTDATMIPESTEPYEDVLDLDVTAMVQTMITEPLTSHGFICLLGEESHYRRRVFASSDAPDTASRPMLEICYNLPDAIVNTTSSNLLMYPNPVSDLQDLVISGVNGAGPVFIELYNILGENIISIPHQIANASGNIVLSAEQLDPIPPGEYILRSTGIDSTQTAIINKCE